MITNTCQYLKCSCLPVQRNRDGRAKSLIPLTQAPEKAPKLGFGVELGGAGQGDADPAEGRHAGLQAVCRERIVSAIRW